MAERVGFEPTVRLPVQTSSKIPMLYRLVAKRVRWFANFGMAMSSCNP
jgi:hypothetical protein